MRIEQRHQDREILLLRDKFASSVGWTDDQYDVVDGYISVRFGPFRSRVEFRHDLLEPSMPEMGDEDLRCSPPFFG